MKIRRRDIIRKRQQEATHRLRKTFLKKVNIGFVAFASGSFLTSLTQNTLVAQAMDSVADRGFSKSQFLDLVAHSAQLIAGENDLYASVMIAQAALESGWGNSGLASAPNYNLFGIKGNFNGQSVLVNTLEDDGTGSYYQIKDGFRKYDNYSQSLQDYANLLTGNHDESSWRYNYYYGARKSQTNSYHDATAHLTGRYATDTSYAYKLNRIIEENNLTRFDMPGQTKTIEVGFKKASTVESGKKNTHLVKPGDSYWAIARKYGVSLTQLQALNNNAAVIYPGQELQLPNSQQNEVTHLESSVTVEPTSQVTATGSYHTVSAGESYWAIARRYGVSVSDLQQANGNAAVIHPGQQLKLPESTQATVPVEEKSAESTQLQQEVAPAADTTYYTVQPGDTLWRIARTYGIDLDELKQINNTTSSMIYVGQQIQLGHVQAANNVEAPTAEPVASVQGEENNIVFSQTIEQPTQEVVEAPSASIQTIQEVAQTGSSQHVVQAGDTLYSIARRNGLDVYQLIESNGSTLIKPGQVIEW